MRAVRMGRPAASPARARRQRTWTGETEILPRQLRVLHHRGGLAAVPQRQQYLALALNPDAPPIRSADELAGATLRIEYNQPGWFQWGEPGGVGPNRRAIALGSGAEAGRVLRPVVREHTREAALRALQQVDPAVREALLQAMRRSDPRIEIDTLNDAAQIFPSIWEAVLRTARQHDPTLEEAQIAPNEAQIVPTELNLAIVPMPGSSNRHSLHVVRANGMGAEAAW